MYTSSIDRTLIWTNSNPSSSISTINIPVDYSGFDAIEIRYRPTTSIDYDYRVTFSTTNVNRIYESYWIFGSIHLLDAPQGTNAYRNVYGNAAKNNIQISGVIGGLSGNEILIPVEINGINFS